MRATGFFYRGSQGCYLVTARHNALPTKINVKHPDGRPVWKFSSSDFLPEIEIYLRNTDGWNVEHVDIRDVQERIVTGSNIDILAIPVEFDPVEYRYAVYTDDDVTDPREESEMLTVYGFGSESLPDKGTADAVEEFKNGLGTPLELSFENLTGLSPGRDPWNGTFGRGIDAEPSPELDYNGLSGSPVLGNGLVGVHSGTANPPEPAIKRNLSLENSLLTRYFGAKNLAEHL